MLLLTTTASKLSITTDGSETIFYTCSYVDITTTNFTPDSTQGTISSATTTDIIAAPAASTQRQIKYISICNFDTTSSDISIRKNVSGVEYVVLEHTLDANTTLQYIDTDGWAVFPAAVGGGAGLVDADYGDVTVSSSGTVMTIDNDVVTYAKMQNVSATDKLLGRSTSGAGDVEEIDCTAAGRALLDDASASDQRTTLGLTTLATTTPGTGIATFLTTPSSANLASALTDETGTGAAVFANTPTLVTPILGTPTSGILTNCTGLPVAGGGTGVASTTAYAVQCGGTTSTGAFQAIASLGSSGAKLTSMGAGALPQMKGGLASFRAHMGSANVTVSHNTNTKLNTFANETFDTGSYFDTSTSRFTPLIAGIYFIGFSLRWNSTFATQPTNAYFMIYKNGSIFAVGYAVNVVSTTGATYYGDYIQFNGSTDYVELYAYQDTGSSKDVAGSSACIFFGTLVEPS